MAIKHTFVSAIADDPQAVANGEVTPTNWNDDHTIEDGTITEAQLDSDVQTKLNATASGGVADYNDTATATTPISLTTDTWTTITNNGAGEFTNLSYLPVGVTQLLNTSTGQFDFSELALGDYVIIRNDYTVTPNTNNSLLELRYQLGTGVGAYTLQKIVARLDSGSGIGYRFSLTPDFIYMGDANTRDNPVTLQLRLSTAGTVVNSGSAIGVNKR